MRNSMISHGMHLGDGAHWGRLAGVKTVLFTLALFLVTQARAETEPRASQDPPSATGFVEHTQELIIHALAFSGVRYRWGGKTPESGLDCSGFVRYVFQEAVGIALPHDAYSMSLIGRTVRKPDLRPGDLVFFNTLKRAFSHVGIYLGDNRFIHAPRTGKYVEIGDLGAQYWSARFNGGRRVLEANPS